MCCSKYQLRILSFAMALTLGIFAASFFRSDNAAPPTPSLNGNGGGYAIEQSQTKPLRVFSRPRPNYTDAARRNQVEGVVRLKVTFLYSGQIGDVSVVSELPNGLTEQALAAAKNLKFEPEMRDGKPVTVVKTLEYSFSIY